MQTERTAATRYDMGTTNGEYYFDDKLLEPLHYITRMPGKKIRTKLIQVDTLSPLLSEFISLFTISCVCVFFSFQVVQLLAEDRRRRAQKDMRHHRASTQLKFIVSTY